MDGLGWLINFIHILVCAYFVLIPLLSSHPVVLRDYLILSAFLWLHWLTNNDTCALTTIESYLCELPPEQTFFGRLVGPVYNITSRQIYLIHLALIGLAIYKLR
jgi:hypothetical protein